MNINDRYSYAKARYAELGVDTDKAIETLKNIGIESIKDLVEYYPYRHDLIVLDNIKECVDKQNVTIECIIDSVPLSRRFRANMTALTFRAM